jgi:hypothetical protein
LRGISTGKIEVALQDFFGVGTKGIIEATVSQLTKTWQRDFVIFKQRN